MGLDIYTYTNLTPAPPGVTEDDQFSDGRYYFRVSVHSGFPGRCNLPNGSLWSYDDVYHFRAGTYLGYNVWREKLAEMAGYPAHTHRGELSHAAGCWKNPVGPFAELINFSDSEGTMSGPVCQKLYSNFREYRWVAEKIAYAVPPLEPGQWLDVYDRFMDAFRRATVMKGAVDFC